MQAGRAQLARNEAADAAGTLRRALQMWRGPAFADVRDEPFAQVSIARLNEQRIAALADRIDADLALGRYPQLTGELQALVSEHPLRERLRAQLILALYGSGRQSDALAVYRDARRTLTEELGVEPGRELRDVHQLVLRHGELPPAAGPVLRAIGPSRVTARRRMLTCVVAVPHGTAVSGGHADPEAVRAVLLDLRSQIVRVSAACHGTVRDSDAAAFTIIFGWPGSREDDVMNAVAAASQLVGGWPGWPAEPGLRPALPLGIGVATGEVVTAPGADAPLLLGELAEQAGALARAARAGQVLVAPSTWQLISHAADGSPAAADAGFAGAGQDVMALTAVDADAASIQRTWEGPYIGREADLGLLDSAFGAVRQAGGGRLVTVLGEAGIGKTRLSLEFERLARPDAVVLRSRCRLYDEDIPYRSVQEILEQAAGGAAPEEWLARIGVGADVSEVILAVLGRSQERTGGQVRWAISQVMAAITRHIPAVVIFDDVQHAPPELLDLLDALAVPLRGMPVLLLCLARPELQQTRPGWAASWRPASDADAAAAERGAEPRAPRPGDRG